MAQFVAWHIPSVSDGSGREFEPEFGSLFLLVGDSSPGTGQTIFGIIKNCHCRIVTSTGWVNRGRAGGGDVCIREAATRRRSGPVALHTT